MIWGVGEDRDKAYEGRLCVVDITKATGECHVPTYSEEHFGVFYYGSRQVCTRQKLPLEELQATKVFERVALRIEAAYHSLSNNPEVLNTAR
ncbi:MAG TPA: hypothetical protein VK145_01735 [Candidatus Nanoarchaeia archaeon]|nr:hypothetical protein [Candidatus Nanoarchaeia archaeon]